MIDVFTNEIQSWNRVKGYMWPNILIASDVLMAQSLIEASHTSTVGSQTVLAKQVKFYHDGTIRVKFDWNGNELCGYKLYVDTVLISEAIAFSEGDYAPDTWHSVTVDVPVKFWQSLKLYNHTFDTGMVAKVRNLKLYWEKIKYKKNLEI